MFPYRERINGPNLRERERESSTSSWRENEKGLINELKKLSCGKSEARLTMRDSHVKVSETCPFSLDSLDVFFTKAAYERFELLSAFCISLKP